MERLRTSLLVLLTLAVAVCSPALGQEQDATVKIGVLAKRGAERCLEKWEPTAEYLTSQIPGHSFTIVPLDFDEVSPVIERGEVDFVLANPAFYVELEELYGANRIATLKNKWLDGVYTVFGGVIFRRADRDDIQDFDDLKGKIFMIASERAFSGWYAVWRELKERGIDPYHDFAELTIAGTYDAVVYAVADGKVDAGSVKTDTLERMAMEGKIRLEDYHILRHDSIGEDVCEFPFLHSTAKYPEWPFTRVAHTSNELAEKVAVALMDMPADCPAAQAAKCAGWTVPLNYQPVHDCLKELRVGPYKDYGKITLADTVRSYWPWMAVGLAALVVMIAVTLWVIRLNRDLSLVQSELRESNAELARVVSAEKNRSYQQAELSKFGQVALAGISLDDLFDQAVSLISRTLGTKYAKVLEHLPQQGVLFLRAGVGWKEGWVGHKSVPDGAGSQGGYTLLQDKPVIAEDIENETRFSPPALLTEHNAVGGMTVAIPGLERPFGILGVYTDRMQRFSEDDVHFLKAVANTLAAALQRRAGEEAIAARTAELQQRTAELQHRTAELEKSRRVAMGMMEDAEQARKVAESAREELEVAATTDRLTGLPNRAVFQDRLSQVIKQSHRDGGRFAVLFFDFDRFKVVNDSLGHEVGDALLCDIAGLFRRELRESDTAARIGGDEFVVLLSNLSEWSDAWTKAERLLKVFAAPHSLEGHQVVSTASIGLVTNERAYESANEMIRDADAAMYQAKEAGKGRVVVFDRAMHEQAMDRLTLEEDLRVSVKDDQLKLVYQPIVSLETGELSGFEALVRWEHPKQGTVSPVIFVPIAEDTGMITDIGRWVLRTASRQIADWNRRLGQDHRLSVNVNLSKRELLDPSILDVVLECQRECGLRPEDLNLEVTESTVVDERSDIVPLLRALRERGFPIAMDDFGTGLSSLGALHDYPIDVLKIDQSFIRVLDNDRSLLAVVSSITTLADNLGIKVVAEGIETESILGALQSVGCTWGQGYYFAKPMTAADAEAYILGMHRGTRTA